MEDDSDNTLIGWILGIAVTLSLAIALLAGVAGLNSGTDAPAAATPVSVTPAPAPAAEAAATRMIAKVYFDSGVTAMPADASAALQPIIDTARARAETRVSISGFHDKTGNPEQNAELAKQRAFAVRDALVAGGIADTRIELRKPEETQGNGDDREARRVEASIE